MAWSTPRVWSVGEILTAANMNTYLSSELSYLHGDAGAVTINNEILIRNIAPAADGYCFDFTASTTGAALIHLYNSASIAEWQFGQRSGTDSDFKLSKKVAGTITDIFRITPVGDSFIGTAQLHVHRHPFTLNRHIDSGFVSASVPNATTVSTSVSYDWAYATAPQVVLGNQHGILTDNSPFVNVTLNSTTGFTMVFRQALGSTQSMATCWLADGNSVSGA